LNWFIKTLLANVIQVFEKTESLQKKVLYLVKTVDTISKEKSNLEDVLASQTCVFGKSDLGFNPQSKQSGCPNLYQLSPKKNRLKNRNN